MRVNQPSNQIKLTNVSIVRYKKGGNQFQIAAYRNKVLEWRSGIEKDLDEVLQIHNIFINVSKGQVAPDDKIKKSFGSMTKDAIILEILKKGEVQIDEEERREELDRHQAAIIEMISQKVVNPRTKRPYTPSIIGKSLTEAKFNPALSKSVKAQALEGIKLLISNGKIPIARAKMRIKISSSINLKESLADMVETVEESSGDDGVWHCMALLEPMNYKQVGDTVRSLSNGTGRIEVTEMTVIQEGEEHF